MLPFVCFRFLKLKYFFCFYFCRMATEHRTLVYIIVKKKYSVCNSWRMENGWWEKTKPTNWKKNGLSRHLNVLLNNMRKLCLNWTIEDDGLQSLLISFRHSCVMHMAYREEEKKNTTKLSMDYRTGDSIHFLSFCFHYALNEVFFSVFFRNGWMNEMLEFKWPFMLCHVTKVIGRWK